MGCNISVVVHFSVCRLELIIHSVDIYFSQEGTKRVGLGNPGLSWPQKVNQDRLSETNVWFNGLTNGQFSRVNFFCGSIVRLGYRSSNFAYLQVRTVTTSCTVRGIHTVVRHYIIDVTGITIFAVSVFLFSFHGVVSVIVNVARTA